MSTAHAHFHTLPFHNQTTDPIDHEPVGEKGAVLEQGVGDRRDATASPIAGDLATRHPDQTSASVQKAIERANRPDSGRAGSCPRDAVTTSFVGGAHDQFDRRRLSDLKPRNQRPRSARKAPALRKAANASAPRSQSS